MVGKAAYLGRVFNELLAVCGACALYRCSGAGPS